MNNGRCPVCGARQFYIKDPDDQYNIAMFRLDSGEVIYENEEPDSDQIAIDGDSEVFCEKCAWHDKFLMLQKE